MTIYSGKDASVYFGEKKIATATAKVILSRREYTQETDYGEIITLHRKPRAGGELTAWDRGADFMFHSLPYKYINSSGKIQAEFKLSDGTEKAMSFYALGDWQFNTTSYQKSFGGTYVDQEFWLYTDNLLPDESDYAIEQVGMWVKGIGAPDNSTYKLQLVDYNPAVVWDSNVDETYLYTWADNDDKWIYSDITSLDLPASDVNKYKLRLIENTSTADTDNCVVAYTHALGSPPYLNSPSYTAVCNILVSNFEPKTQVFDVKITLDDTWTIFCEGCNFQDIEKSYSPDSVSSETIAFSATSWKIYQE